MIRPKDIPYATELDELLVDFFENTYALPGIVKQRARKVLVAQIIESVRRIKFVEMISNRPLSPLRADPSSDIFDPLRAAIIHIQANNRGEAYWLVFLATHFSKHHITGWGLLKAIYGKLGELNYWDWKTVINDPPKFYDWVAANQAAFTPYRFGNHRKYESKKRTGNRGIEAVVGSYINWVSPPVTHQEKIDSVVNGANDPTVAFERLYKSAKDIKSWGRLALFDHLTMLGKLKLANIKPGRTFLSGATGPRLGAALLLTGERNTYITTKSSEAALILLGDSLGVGQQVMEDSLCNWQKSPEKFIAFR